MDVGRKALHLRARAHVDPPRQHVTAEPAEVALGLLEPRLIELTDHQPRAPTGASQCDLAADAATGARHQRGGSREVADVHRSRPEEAELACHEAAVVVLHRLGEDLFHPASRGSSKEPA